MSSTIAANPYSRLSEDLIALSLTSTSFGRQLSNQLLICTLYNLQISRSESAAYYK